MDHLGFWSKIFLTCKCLVKYGLIWKYGLYLDERLTFQLDMKCPPRSFKISFSRFFFSFRMLQDENYSLEAFKQNGLAVLNFSLGIFRTQKWSSLYRGFNLWNIFNPFKSVYKWESVIWILVRDVFGLKMKPNHLASKVFFNPWTRGSTVNKIWTPKWSSSKYEIRGQYQKLWVDKLAKNFPYDALKKSFWKKSWNMIKSIANYDESPCKLWWKSLQIMCACQIQWRWQR